MITALCICIATQAQVFTSGADLSRSLMIGAINSAPAMPAPEKHRQWGVSIMLPGELNGQSVQFPPPKPYNAKSRSAKARHILQDTMRGQQTLASKRDNREEYRNRLAAIIGSYYSIVRDYPETRESKLATERLRKLGVVEDSAGRLSISVRQY